MADNDTTDNTGQAARGGYAAGDFVGGYTGTDMGYQGDYRAGSYGTSGSYGAPALGTRPTYGSIPGMPPYENGFGNTNYYGNAGPINTPDVDDDIEAVHVWQVRSVPGPHAGRGPSGYRRSDARIMEDICDRLMMHGLLDASGINVNVNDAVVTLQGKVDTRAAKRMAGDTAESVPGVQDVHNQLRIEQNHQNK